MIASILQRSATARAKESFYPGAKFETHDGVSTDGADFVYRGRGRSHLIACAIGLLCAMANPSLARANDTAALLEFFAGQGCAIGPTTREAAIAAGFETGAIDAFAETARADEETMQTGDWLILSSASCEIRAPEVTSAIQLTDPEVIKHVSAADAYAEEGDPGCFLTGPDLLEEVQVTRNWDVETAFLEYMRFLSASLLSGDLAFYSNNPLRTPVGFVVTTGECAEIPVVPEIKRNHQFLIEFFNPLIRANAASVVCQSGASPMSVELHDIASKLSGGESTNAWLGIEIQIIAMGAGWYEGMSTTNKGTPRPPLCHYE